ncbi:MAG: sigma-54 dependent transcriptional regulator [Myxococcota bacterium]|nr:sigma-54 dependent transcriptional regulator [Myxococcota bacterium]
MTDKVLVVDDEESLRTVLGMLLRRQGYEVTTVCDGEEALEALSTQAYSVLLTDLRMPNLDGLGLLRRTLENWPEMPVIMLTAHGTVDTAVEALKMGAFDFLSKGCDNDEVLKIVGKAVATRTMRLAEPRLQVVPTATAPTTRFGLIGQSAAMQQVFNIVNRVAKTPSTILITGESGTGKELIAKALHNHSGRADAPFIRVNCAAIPDTLIESELFGYEKGAFTGATSSKPGRFELANGGTLFLDEIGEISTEMQVKLLRAIQESEFERVGGIKTIEVDVRLITATNRDLHAQVQAGQFREDLFYRLNVVPIKLPALRERIEDISLLARHILGKFAKRLGQSERQLASDALDVLCAYSWPGNIRELENVLERTLLFSERDPIGLDDLPLELQKNAGAPTDGGLVNVSGSTTDLKEAVRNITRKIEKQMIESVLLETEGNVTQGAKRLGISRKSLQTKMKEFGLRSLEE